MMRDGWIHILLYIWLPVAVLTSCTNEGYDTGDGSLSYLCVEFADVFTAADTTMSKAITDDGETVEFARHLKAGWASAPDSSYRALLYYSKEGTPSKVFSLRQVPVLRPEHSADTIATDPLSVESIWTSGNGKYVNLSLLLKAGVSDSIDNRQWLSLYTDQTDSTDNECRLLLLHGQNGVPEYYTTRIYISISVSTLPQAKDVSLRVNTYQGMKTYMLQRR